MRTGSLTLDFDRSGIDQIPLESWISGLATQFLAVVLTFGHQFQLGHGRAAVARVVGFHLIIDAMTPSQKKNDSERGRQLESVVCVVRRATDGTDKTQLDGQTQRQTEYLFATAR